MKKGIGLLLAIFIYNLSCAQITINPISVLPIQGLDTSKPDNGIRTVEISIHVDIPDTPRQIVDFDLIDQSLMIGGPANTSGLIMSNSSIVLPPAASTSSGDYPITCPFKLMKPATKKESYFLRLKNMPLSQVEISVLPSAAVASTTTSGTKTKPSLIHLDNGTTQITLSKSANNNIGNMATLDLVLTRDSLPSAKTQDTIFLSFEKINLPEPKNKGEDFKLLLPDQPVIIQSSEWTTKDNKGTYKIKVKIDLPDAADLASQEAYARIKVVGDDKSFHLVRLVEDTLRYQHGFMFLVAGSFDFDNFVKSSFLGHANVWSPQLTHGRFLTFGINAGIMKVDYTKGPGDQPISSLNNTYYVVQNVLVNPLQREVGAAYIRQYNKIQYSTAPTSWSFYAQPTYRILHRNKIDIYANAHFELYVNKWKLHAVVSKLSEENDTIRVGDSSLVFQNENRFSETSVVYDSSGIYTAVNVNVGAGFIFDIRPWKNAILFVQSSFGWVANENNIPEIDTISKVPKIVEHSRNFFLTRFYLKQRLSNTLEAVLGYDCRGIFDKQFIPSYATYIGVNVSLNGLVELLK